MVASGGENLSGVEEKLLWLDATEDVKARDANNGVVKARAESTKREDRKRARLLITMVPSSLQHWLILSHGVLHIFQSQCVIATQNNMGISTEIFVKQQIIIRKILSESRRSCC